MLTQFRYRVYTGIEKHCGFCLSSLKKILGFITFFITYINFIGPGRFAWDGGCWAVAFNTNIFRAVTFPTNLSVSR